MRNESSLLIIDACDVFGNRITCTYKRWQEHIISVHDEFLGRHDEVSEMISAPDHVYASVSHPNNRYIICGVNTDRGKKFCKVVVHYEGGKGTVVTAYTAELLGGDNIDEQRKLYSSDNL